MTVSGKGEALGKQGHMGLHPNDEHGVHVCMLVRDLKVIGNPLMLLLK